MAARAHAMDQVLFRSVAARAGRRRECRPPRRRSSADLRLAHLFGHQPGVHGLDVGGLVASDGRCHPAWHGVALETPPLAQDVEVTGPVAAVLWVASSTEDMDLFLTIRNIDGDGNEVLETGQQGTPVPVAKGWLRVSHRELDPELSLPYRPYHRHQRRLYLTPGEIVRVEVEIWPTSMVFKKGHRIRLDIQPRDGVGSSHYMHYHADYNTGSNTIYAGGDMDSHLLLPVIPTTDRSG